MRRIDADALQTTFINDCGGECACCIYNKNLEGCKLIDNAPTVEPFEPDYVGAERLKARQRGYNDGYRNGMEIGKTLNPKIKRGEWEEIKSSCDIGHKFYHCSVCNRFLDVMEADGETLEDYPFCHCGADMRGGIE